MRPTAHSSCRAQGKARSAQNRPAQNSAIQRTIMSLVSASMAEARRRFSAVVPARSTLPLWHTVEWANGNREQIMT